MFDFLRRKKTIEVLETEFGKQIPISEITGFVLKGKLGKKYVILNTYNTVTQYGEVEVKDEEKYSMITMFINREGKPNVAYWTRDLREAVDAGVEMPEDIEKMVKPMMEAATKMKSFRDQLGFIVAMLSPVQASDDELLDRIMKRADKYEELNTKLGREKAVPFKNEFIKMFTDPRVKSAGMTWIGGLADLAKTMNEKPVEQQEDNDIYIPDSEEVVNNDKEEPRDRGQPVKGDRKLGQSSRSEEVGRSKQNPDVYDKYVKDEFREDKTGTNVEQPEERSESNRVTSQHVPERVQTPDIDNDSPDIPRDGEGTIDTEEFMIPKEAKKDIKPEGGINDSEESS